MGPGPTDPTAATVSPSERARTPRRTNPRAHIHPPSPVQLHPEITGRIEEDLTLHPDGAEPPARERAEPTLDLQAAIAAVVEPLEEEPTDHGTPPVPAEPRPYAHLDYEERVCRLLEDIRENTRLINLRLGAEEHLRNVAQTGAFDLAPEEEPRTLLEATRKCIVAWFLDPEVKRIAVKVAVVCSTAGGSMVGGASTVALGFELVERLLRAWVQLP